jgi:hypothetical protein
MKACLVFCTKHTLIHIDIGSVGGVPEVWIPAIRQPVGPTGNRMETVLYRVSESLGRHLSDLNTVYYRADACSGRVVGKLEVNRGSLLTCLSH